MTIFVTKTYLPGLLKVAKLLCRYIERNEDFIRDHLSPENEVVLDAALVACLALETMLEDVIPAET